MRHFVRVVGLVVVLGFAACSSSDSGNTGGGGTAGSTSAGGAGGAGGLSGAGGSGAAGNAGDSGSSQDGGDGGGAGDVEYLACEFVGGLAVLKVYRVDPASGTCVMLAVSDSQANGCVFGVTSGNWCLVKATMGNDVQTCQAGNTQSTTIAATAATGTFALRPGQVWDIDITFEFPGDSGQPAKVPFQVIGCLPNCTLNDCRI